MRTNNNYQDLFYMPKGVYALSHSVGPLTKNAQQALQNDFVQTWANDVGDAWPHWLASVNKFCASIAKVVGAHENEICPQPNLASGFSAFLTAIAKLNKHKHQRVILMHEDAFASMGFVVQGLAETFKLELVLIKGHPNDLDLWFDAFEQHAVLACLITHVHSNTSVASDVEKICAIARQFEAFALVDVAQSIGIMPISVKQWRADAVFGSCVKWLCGGPGAGFMYVNNDLIGYLQPDPVGWFSHQNPFEFDIRHYQANDAAKRFWGGTPSIAPYVMANASINMLLDIGLGTIHNHNFQLKTALYEAVRAYVHDLPYALSIAEYGGSLCLSPTNIAHVVSNLQKALVKFDQRGDTLRLSMHINNSLEDVALIASCFKQS